MWTVTTNMRGYLPEVEPVEFDTWADAHTYAEDLLTEWWDQDYINSRTMSSAFRYMPLQIDAWYLDAHTAMHAATPEEPTFYVIPYPNHDQIITISQPEEAL